MPDFVRLYPPSYDSALYCMYYTSHTEWIDRLYLMNVKVRQGRMRCLRSGVYRYVRYRSVGRR